MTHTTTNTTNESNGIENAYTALAAAQNADSYSEEADANLTTYYSDMLVYNQTVYFGGSYTTASGSTGTTTGLIPTEVNEIGGSNSTKAQEMIQEYSSEE